MTQTPAMGIPASCGSVSGVIPPRHIRNVDGTGNIAQLLKADWRLVRLAWCRKYVAGNDVMSSQFFCQTGFIGTVYRNSQTGHIIGNRRMGLQIVQWALETGDMEFDADAAEIIEDTPFLVQIAQALHFFA